MTKFRNGKVYQSFVFFLFIVSMTLAQGPNPFAPSSAMDTLNEAPVGGGLSSPSYIDRARQVGIAPRVNTPKNVGKDEMADPETMMYAEAMAGPRARGGRTGNPQGTPVATPAPTPKMVRVLSGFRVQCAVTGVLLEDIVYKEVPEAEKGNYFDDGSHGDAEAGDGTYTNITVRNDVMSPEAHAILQKMMTLLNNIEDAEPMDFYRLNVATSEPLSSLPKQIDEEQDRDIKLTEWNDRFLRMFRQDENDPRSKFYPIYIPSPPSYPNVPLPQGFQPVVKATPTPTALGQGMNITGEGAQGHMGSYFRSRGSRGGGEGMRGGEF